MKRDTLIQVAIQVFFKDGSSSERVEISYPIGHRRRRAEGIPVLIEKFRDAVGNHFDAETLAEIDSMCGSQSSLDTTPVPDFVDEWIQ